MNRWHLWILGSGAVGLLGLLAGCQAAKQSGSVSSGPSEAAQSAPRSSAQEEPDSARSDGQARPRRARPEESAQPGVFDFYLLTLSWSPEYCISHPTDVQCGPQPGFVLHGLWPENANGTYPEDCSNAPGPANPAQYKDIYPDESLLEHEWTTHGTCSGLAPDAYFQLERQAKASVHIPANLSGKQTPAQETPAQLVSSFAAVNNGDPAADFAVSCGNNRLTAVQVCLDKTLKAISCSSVRSCAASVVKITAP